VYCVRLTRTRTAECSAFATEILQIPAQLIQVASETIGSEMHEFITSFLNKEELPEDQKPLVVFLICSSRETDYSNYRITTIL
jgi:hypothetical protein